MSITPNLPNYPPRLFLADEVEMELEQLRGGLIKDTVSDMVHDGVPVQRICRELISQSKDNPAYMESVLGSTLMNKIQLLCQK